MLLELKQTHSVVFSEPTYPVKRDLKFEHTIELADKTKPPSKRKLYPLDKNELGELKQ